MRRLRVFLLNTFLLLIPLLAGAWLLIVQPAHAQYPHQSAVRLWYGSDPNLLQGAGGGGNNNGPIINDTGDNTGAGSTGTGSNTGGGNTGYPGSTGGGNTGYPGSTGGGNTGYPGSTGGGNTGYPGSTGGGNTGYPGSTGGGNTGYPGSTGGGNTGYPGSTGGGNTGYPGSTGGGNTGYPGSTGGGNTGYPGTTGGSNTGYPGTTGGSNTGYPGTTGGSNTGYPGTTGGSNTGYPGTTGGSNTGYPGTTGGSNTGYPGTTGGSNTGCGTDGNDTGGSGTDGNDTGGSGTDGTGTGGTGTGGPVTPGHWDTSYSSQGTTNWDYVGYDANYKSIAKSDSHQWPATASGDGTYGDYYLDADTTGTVTATLTWVPTTGQDSTTDPPSSSVIVTETGYASESGGGSGTGKADDGWGDSAGGGGSPGDSSGSGPASGSTSSSGTHYEVKDGSSGSITITKTLSASTPKNTTPDAEGNFSAVGAMVSVFLAVGGANTTISLTGTNGTDQALTGQQVKAHLNGPPTNVSSYTWSFSTGTPIKDWDCSWPKFPASADPAQIVPLTAADETGTDKTGTGILVADINFYDPKQEDLTVTCLVKFTLPDGTASSMTVNSPKISFLKPTAKWIVGISFNGTQPGFFRNQPQGSFSAGEIWGPITITEPGPFAGKGYGTGSLVQIATLGRSWTRIPINNKPPTYSKIQTISADGSTKMLVNPTGLDVGCPYPYGFFPNGDPSNPDPKNWTLSLSNYTWPTSTKGFAIDAPYQPYVIADQDNGGTDWRTSTASDSFNTWVMYEPPSKDGMGTIPVPLQKLKWVWGGTATLDTNTRLWRVQQNPQFNPGSPNVADDYPAWTRSIPFLPTVGP